MSLLRNKRGVVEVQINWIFVLVAGVLILLFFAGLIVKQKSVSEVKQAISIQNGLDLIFTSASVSSGTSNVLTVPKLDVSFDCNGFLIGEARKSIGSSQIVFAPSHLTGSKLFTWSLPWNLPFKVTDFLFLSSPDYRYIFVFDESDTFAQTVYDSIPVGVNKEKLKDVSLVGNLVDGGHKFVRFVVFGKDATFDIRGYFKGEVSAVSVFNRGFSGSVSEVRYYSLESGGFSYTGSFVYTDFNSDFFTPYYPSLYGAIFSDNYNDYVCVMTKAYTRAKLITDVFKKRAELLLGSSCNSFYGDMGSNLNVLISLLDSCIADMRSCNGIDVSSIASLNSDLFSNSCAVIY